MTDEAELLGPISYLVVEFPGNRMTGEGFEELINLVDLGLIRILDLEFVMRDTDGSVAAISLQELDTGDFDISVFEGADSGILDQTDFDEVSEALTPGSSAGILIFENRWATRFIAGMRRGGAEFVAAGYIPHDEIAATLDELD